MTTVLAILAFALLFATFGAIGSRIRAGACHGCPSAEDAARCGACAKGDPVNSQEADVP